MIRLRLSLAAAVSLLALATPPAAAQSWFGKVNGSWSNANNWFPASVPTSSSSTTLQFLNASMSMTTAMTDDIAGTFLLNKMNILAGSPTFTLAGNGLDFRTNLGTIPPTPPSIVMGSANAFTIGAAVTLTNGLTVSGIGAGTLAFNGAISGAGSLTYSGAGTLSLGGSANTYTGGDVVNSGTLALSNGFAIPTGGNVSVASGATFNTNGFSNGNSSSSSNAIGALTLNGGTFRVPSGGGDYWLNQLNMNGGTLDFTGASGFRLHFKNAGAGITFDAASTWTGAGNVSIRNDTASALPITYTGTGTWTAGIVFSGSGSNPNFTFSGGSGVRLTNAGNTANMNFSNTYLYTNDLSTNVGSGAFGTLGAGTVTIGNLVYDGPTATSAKPLSLTGSSIINVSTGGANLTLNGVINQSAAGAALLAYGNFPSGSTLTLTGANTYSGPTSAVFDITLAVPTIANGGVASPIGASSNAPTNLVLGSGNNNDRSTLLLTGTNATYSTDRGATLSLGLYANGGGGAIGVQNAATTLTISGQITGPGTLIKTGAGTLVLSNSSNNFTGGTYVEAGTLTLGSARAISTGGNVTVLNGAVLDIGAFGNFPATAIGAVTLNGGTLRAGTMVDYFYLNKLVTDATGGTIDATGSTSFGSLHFTNAGAGITVNGNSTWTGPSSFYIANDAGAEMPFSIAPTATVTSGLGLVSDNSLNANSFRVTGGGTLYLTNPAAAQAFVRVSQARLRMDFLTNVSPGNFDLTLDNGTLQYGGSTTTADAFTVGPGGGTLEVLNAATTLTLTGALSGGIGGLTKSGPGTLVLANAGNLFNGLTVNVGVVQTANDNTLSIGAVTVNGGTLRYTATTSSGRTFYLNSGALEVAGGATLTLNGATVNGGFLRGAGTYAVTGGTTLSGVTTFNSTTVSVTGAGTFQNYTSGGSLNVAAGLALPVAFDGFTNQGSGTITIAASSKVNASDFQSYGLLTLNPAAGGSGQITELTNTGSSPMYFNGGSRTFIGTPATATASPPVAGVDLHGQNLVIAGGLFANNGFVADSTATPGSVIVDYGALYKGAGTNFVNVITQNGGKVQAGNSPGRFVNSELTLGPGGVGNFLWQINDAGPSGFHPNAPGVAGPTPDANNQVSGWGLIESNKGFNPLTGQVSTGDLTWTASSAPGSQFVLSLQTLMNPTTVGSDNPGPMADFDYGQFGFAWPLITWQGNYTGPTDSRILTADTLFDKTGFANPIVTGGSFSIAFDPVNPKQIDLIFNGVPEPGTLVLTGLAAAGWLMVRRRRSRARPTQL